MNDDKRKAAALKYRFGKDKAPKLTGKGSGPVAERIIEVAKEHGIPIREDRLMVEMLSQLELNAQIPEELYRAVAEIFAFIYRSVEQPESSQS